MDDEQFQIDTVAQLAMLDLDDQERALFGSQLPSIMSYVSSLQEVDTAGTQASAYLTQRKNVVREDRVCEQSSQTHEALVGSFPEQKGQALQIPAIFE